MASQRQTGARFRQKKLSVKQNLAICREGDVDATLDDEAQRNIPKVDTGVEKHEEGVSSIESLFFPTSSSLLDSIASSSPRARDPVAPYLTSLLG